MSISKLSKFFGNRGRGSAALWPVLVSGPAFWGPALSQSRYPWPERAVAAQVCLQADLAALVRSAMGMLFSNLPKSERANIEVVQKWEQDIARTLEDSVSFTCVRQSEPGSRRHICSSCSINSREVKKYHSVQAGGRLWSTGSLPYTEPITCSTRI